MIGHYFTMSVNKTLPNKNIVWIGDKKRVAPLYMLDDINNQLRKDERALILRIEVHYSMSFIQTKLIN